MNPPQTVTLLATVTLALLGCARGAPPLSDVPAPSANDVSVAPAALHTTSGQPIAGAGLDTVWAGVGTGTVGAGVVSTVARGDTIRILTAGGSERVRLLAVEAPEVDGCGASEAAAFVAGRVPPGTTVWLERDGRDRDDDGALLRYVWRDDGTLLNEQVLAAGWAQAEPSLHGGRRASLQWVERAARDAARGIWAVCDMSVAHGRQRATQTPAKERTGRWSP
jgi:endonuclease YncB( thermonuclease family)